MKKGSDESLKSMVYKSMYEDIMLGKYLPGMTFSEKDLVEIYQISKSPIREALIELCNEGMLRSIPRFGYEVLEISQSELRDVKETRAILELGALNICFDKISSEDISHLRKVIENAHNEGEKSVLLHWNRNIQFHLELATLAGNEYLIKQLQSTLTLMGRAYSQYQSKKHNKTTFKSGESHNHANLIDAIEKKDKEKALEILARDLDSFELLYIPNPLTLS
ncbi:MAG: GntR family transcriptional regulator [Spirochaetales bacterium]|uniref:GntR family transcriptional regulator n=1 Tax=Bullifex sp. TaxID=2815808 RepID=UPI002A544F02|nr:GntR family transcriptional regulator [Bullifex sp.]MDD5972728.1 GntR family transcriptional regulator [Spirochaetales bacterium]MDD7271017.1 GntR family transcriptional regulator [Spirochaetales bacterium]MDY4067670.1 GntR family transcriptional regulator [Bullifex sp.]